MRINDLTQFQIEAVENREKTGILFESGNVKSLSEKILKSLKKLKRSFI